MRRIKSKKIYYGTLVEKEMKKNSQDANVIMTFKQIILYHQQARSDTDPSDLDLTQY